MRCPRCGQKIESLTCAKCGYDIKSDVLSSMNILSEKDVSIFNETIMDEEIRLREIQNVESRLQITKSKAIRKLSSYKNISEYRRREQEIFASTIKNAKKRIKTASTEDEVGRILTEVNAVISGLKTDEELAEYEERNQKEIIKKHLDAEKKSAIEELSSYKDVKFYRPKEQEMLLSSVDEYTEAINNAETVGEVGHLLGLAETYIDGIKTISELLDVEKKSAIEELTNYKDARIYRKNEQARLLSIIKERTQAINDAEEIPEIHVHLDLAKVFMDEIKTDVEMSNEEKESRQTRGKRNIFCIKHFGIALLTVLISGMTFFFVKVLWEPKESIEEKLVIKDVSVGDLIAMGTYEIDGNSLNGKENLKWTVIEIEDDRALVVSENAIDVMQYNALGEDNTWSGSDIRKFLNGPFFKSVFQEDEKGIILEAEIESGRCILNRNLDILEKTNDKVFILDFDTYYTNLSDATFTPYAKSKYKKILEEKGELTIEQTPNEYERFVEEYLYEDYCWCWVRNIGPIDKTVQFMHQFNNARVLAFGNGFCDSNYYNAIRPAMWIQISNSGEK